MPENQQNKSVLDNIEVKEEGFPLQAPAKSEPNAVVSSCPACGAPIYGPRQVVADQATIPLVFSCDCRMKKTIQDSMHMK